MTAICDINLTFVTEKAMGYVPWEATLKVRPGTPTAGSQGLNDFRFQTASWFFTTAHLRTERSLPLYILAPACAILGDTTQGRL